MAAGQDGEIRSRGRAIIRAHAGRTLPNIASSAADVHDRSNGRAGSILPADPAEGARKMQSAISHDFPGIGLADVDSPIQSGLSVHSYRQHCEVVEQ